MNAKERLAETLAGRVGHRPLNFDIFMTAAAHHAGVPLSTYYLDHRGLCAANYAALEDFGVDIVQAISDPYREAFDLGSDVSFPDDAMPVLNRPLLADRDTLNDLVLIDPSSGRRMSDRIEAVRDFASTVGAEVPVLGWVEGSLAEAADLRGVSTLLTDLLDDPAWVEDLLEFCVEQGVAFARAQLEAGADIIGIGDAIASQISPRMYTRFALPYEQRLVEAIHDAGGLARLHICGDTSRLLPLIPQTGVDIVDVDWMVPLDSAAEQVGERVVCGNQDPVAVMLQGTVDEVYAATQECRSLGGTRFISMAGCEIPDGTPIDNLEAQRRALDEPLGAHSGLG